VRWVECIIVLRDLGVRTFVEPGTGGVLTGLLRRIDRSLEGRAVGEPADVEAVVAAVAAA
jgi:[acyl-carrier-protein] S-malonyltransferase